jgi:hypothetical protein
MGALEPIGVGRNTGGGERVMRRATIAQHEILIGCPASRFGA